MARTRKRAKRRIVVINPPRKKRRARARHRARHRKAATVMLSNRRRRRSARAHRSNPRRHYRRNPGLPSTGFIMDAVYVTGGFFATRFAVGFFAPMLPMIGTSDIARIGLKGVLSLGLGWAGGKMLGQKSGQLIMLGGLVETISDAVRVYVSPFVPALADGGMHSYPSLMSYPALHGGDYSDPSNVGAYDEAL